MQSRACSKPQAASKGAVAQQTPQVSDVYADSADGKLLNQPTYKIGSERFKHIRSLAAHADLLSARPPAAYTVACHAQTRDLQQTTLSENELLESQNELLAAQSDVVRLHNVVQRYNLQISDLSATVSSQRAQIRLLQRKCGFLGIAEAEEALSCSYAAPYDVNSAGLAGKQYNDKPNTSALQSELLYHEIDLRRAKYRVCALEAENSALKQQVESAKGLLEARTVENETLLTLKQKYDRLFVQHKIAQKQLRQETSAAALARQQLENAKAALAETKAELASARAVAYDSASTQAKLTNQTAGENSKLKELNRQLALENAGLLEQLGTLYAHERRETESLSEMERLKAQCHDLIKDKLNLTARVELLSQATERFEI